MERISRHNALIDALFDSAVAAGLGPVKEGCFLLPWNNRRPADVLVLVQLDWREGRGHGRESHHPHQGLGHTAGFAWDHAHKGKLDGAEETCRRQGLAFLPLVAFWGLLDGIPLPRGR